ncbi:EEF1A lysine methyltransferase 3-like, partial [Phasianus colchicus]|uniref:EEF1A lysine methyltransferase 3-like n=1 Tax=Phasianus colchicus TaxID=9054 RepID=UPI00129EB98C
MAASTEARRVSCGTGSGEEEEEDDDEDEGSGHEDAAESGPLAAVFPRDPELFSDTFLELRRFRFCGHVLRIAQHHGPRLGMAAAVWDGVRGGGALRGGGGWSW